MSHPYAAHRQTAKEHSRVKHITRGYASGGAVNRTEDDSKVRKMSASQEREVNPEGGVAPHRADRPKRAKGGKVGKHKGNAKTVVNVITGGHPPGVVPPMPGPPAGIAPAAMAPPPMAAKPPMMPPPGAGGPPPGGPPMPMRAKGGAVKSIGMKVGTPVSHTTGKSDLPDMNRKRVVTFMAGGKVKKRADGGGASGKYPASDSAKALGDAYALKPWYGPEAQSARAAAGKAFVDSTKRAKGGRVESPDGVAAATKLPGGGGGGEARLAKAHRAERR